MFSPPIDGLVAVSSFRPLDDSPEFASNQLRAKKSWDDVFDHIILFGDYDARLDSPLTEFVPCEQFPRISLLVLAASWQEDPVCILNADIVVAQHLKYIVGRGLDRGAVACTSHRCEFDPVMKNYDSAKVVDDGADFFCARPHVWAQAYMEIPTELRLGHQLWDQWMLAFLCKRCQMRFWDVSALRPIFHPRHGDRRRVHHIAVDQGLFYDQLGWPPELYI